MDKNTKSLEDLSIYELRDVARNVGVQSPSSKKKDVLIQSVKDIISGKQKPHVKTSNKGRPARSIAQMSTIFDVMMPSILDEPINTLNVNDSDTIFDNMTENTALMLSRNDSAFNDDVKESRVENGQVDMTAKGYGILRVEELVASPLDAYISPMLIEKYNLQKGDSIIANVDSYKIDMPRRVTSIIQINGCEANGYKAFDRKKIANNSQDEQKGRSNLYLYKNNVRLNDKAEQIAKEINNKTGYVSCVEFDCPTDAKIEILDSFDIVRLPFTKTTKDIVISINLALNKCIRQAQMGRDTTLVISSVSKLLTILDSNDTNRVSYENIGTHALQSVKTLLSLPCVYELGGALTIILLDNEKCPKGIKEIIDFEIVPNVDNVYHISI